MRALKMACVALPLNPLGYDWTHYETSRILRIKAPRCATVFNVIALLIYWWGVWELLVDQAYLEYEQPVGSIRPTLKESEGAVFNISGAPYCAGQQRECRILDALDVVFPAQEENKIFITTRLQDRWDELEPCRDPPCSEMRYNTTARQEYFVAGIENLELQIDAAMECRTFNSESRAAQPPKPWRALPVSVDTGHKKATSPFFAAIYDLKGSIELDSSLQRHFPPGQKDRAPLHVWLNAAGLRLDGKSDSSEQKAQRNTFRDEGAVLEVQLEYSNAGHCGDLSLGDLRTWGQLWCYVVALLKWFLSHVAYGEPPNAVAYRYKVFRLPKAESKVRQVLPLADGRRLVRKRHGILIHFVTAGQLGRFGITQFIIKLVALFGSIELLASLTDWAIETFSLAHSSLDRVASMKTKEA